MASAAADLQNAAASVQSARAALLSLNAEEQLAAANVRAAQTLIRSADAQSVRAAADQHRYDNLVSSGAVAKRDADQYRAAAVTAASDADHSRATLDVSRDQAAVTGAKRAAPCAGESGRGRGRRGAGPSRARSRPAGPCPHPDPRAHRRGGGRPLPVIEPGDYVQPGTRRLLTLAPLGSLYVTANFKETQTARMTVGQPATVKVDALPGPAAARNGGKLRAGLRLAVFTAAV